jgi:hypothetical protein
MKSRSLSRLSMLLVVAIHSIVGVSVPSDTDLVAPLLTVNISSPLNDVIKVR